LSNPSEPLRPINQIARDVAMRAFLQDLIHPEQFGHAVSAEVRQRAQELLEWIGQPQ
jgi:hypothetical protein